MATFDVSDRSVSNLSSEMRKFRADLRQEFRDEIRSLRNTFVFPQGSQFSRSYKQPLHHEFGPRSQPSRKDFTPRSQPPSVDNRPCNNSPLGMIGLGMGGVPAIAVALCDTWLLTLTFAWPLGHRDNPPQPPSLKNSYAYPCAFSKSAYHFIY